MSHHYNNSNGLFESNEFYENLDDKKNCEKVYISMGQNQLEHSPHSSSKIHSSICSSARWSETIDRPVDSCTEVSAQVEEKFDQNLVDYFAQSLSCGYTNSIPSEQGNSITDNKPSSYSESADVCEYRKSIHTADTTCERSQSVTQLHCILDIDEFMGKSLPTSENNRHDMRVSISGSQSENWAHTTESNIVVQEQNRLHPKLANCLPWASELFVRMSELERGAGKPDAILDKHLARVWPKREKRMLLEDGCELHGIHRKQRRVVRMRNKRTDLTRNLCNAMYPKLELADEGCSAAASPLPKSGACFSHHHHPCYQQCDVIHHHSNHFCSYSHDTFMQRLPVSQPCNCNRSAIRPMHRASQFVSSADYNQSNRNHVLHHEYPNTLEVKSICQNNHLVRRSLSDTISTNRGKNSKIRPRSSKVQGANAQLRTEERKIIVVYERPEDRWPNISWWNDSHLTLGQYKELVEPENWISQQNIERHDRRYFFKIPSDEFSVGVVYSEYFLDEAILPEWKGFIWGKIEMGPSDFTIQ